MTTSNPSADEEIAGDFKYSSSVVAMNMKTGHLEWGFQGVHHDIWDYDCTTPPVLFNNVFGGLSKEVVDFTCKTDLHYELEQKTGTPVIPVKEEPVPTSAAGKTPDVAAQEHYHASETQPIPEGTSESEVVPHCANEELLPNPAPDSSKYVYSCLFATPGTGEYIAHGINSEGGQDGKTLLAYDPKNGYMYYCETVSVAGAEVGSSKQGGSYIGVNTGWQGSVAAVNVLNNHIVWRDKLMAPGGYCRGGDTVTAGGVLFASREEGTFEAYNAETGAELWSFKGPSDLQAAPIVYEVGGKEYVAIYYGGPNALVGGMTNPRYARMLVFSVGAAAQASVKTLPKSEFSATEEEAAKLAAEGASPLPKNRNNSPKSSGKPSVAVKKEVAPGRAAGEKIFTRNWGSRQTLSPRIRRLEDPRVLERVALGAIVERGCPPSRGRGKEIARPGSNN